MGSLALPRLRPYHCRQDSFRAVSIQANSIRGGNNALVVKAVHACCSRAGGLAASPALAQEKVSVAVLRFVSSGGLFLAVEKGYFKQEGLDVELKFFEAAQPIAVAVVSGDAHVRRHGVYRRLLQSRRARRAEDHRRPVEGSQGFRRQHACSPPRPRTRRA